MRRRIDIIGEARGGGFTLVELLVAVAVASLLLVTLLSILSKSMDISKQANASMMAKGSAQAALDLMVTDLDSLVVSRNAGEVLRLAPGTQVLGADSSVTNTVIYLLTTSMVDSYSATQGGTNAGMPRVVQYSIQYTTNLASTSTKSFGLYRNVLDPTNTFNSVIGTNDLTGVANLPAWTNNNLLVPNVVRMTCALYTNYGAGLWSNGAAAVTNVSSTNFPPGVVVEVSLTVLDESAVPRFADGSGSGNNSATNLINQYGRTLIRRVTLPSPP